MKKLVKRPLAAIAVSMLLVALSAGAASATAAEEKPAQKGVSTQIVGGTDVPDTKYRFVAALLDKNIDGTTFQQQYCGGSLIDTNSILTAAHCVEEMVASDLRVNVGQTVLDNTTRAGGKGHFRDVSRIDIHHNYNSDTLANDVAVLQLSSPVTGITPVSLPSTTFNSLETPGRSLTVAGWGNTIAQPAGGGAGSSWPTRMREAQVPVVSDSQCNTTYDAIYGKDGFIPSVMVCAGQTGKDTCQGDSGGPMFARVNSFPGSGSSRVAYQVGIASFGEGCGASGFPGVYTEVNNPSIRSFITITATAF